MHFHWCMQSPQKRRQVDDREFDRCYEHVQIQQIAIEAIPQTRRPHATTGKLLLHWFVMSYQTRSIALFNLNFQPKHRRVAGVFQPPGRQATQPLAWCHLFDTEAPEEGASDNTDVRIELVPLSSYFLCTYISLYSECQPSTIRSHGTPTFLRLSARSRPAQVWTF